MLGKPEEAVYSLARRHSDSPEVSDRAGSMIYLCKCKWFNMTAGWNAGRASRLRKQTGAIAGRACMLVGKCGGFS